MYLLDFLGVACGPSDNVVLITPQEKNICKPLTIDFDCSSHFSQSGREMDFTECCSIQCGIDKCCMKWRHV